MASKPPASSAPPAPKKALPKFKKKIPAPASTPTPPNASSSSSAQAASPAVASSLAVVKRPPPPGFTGAVKWAHNTAIVAYCTQYFPPDPRSRITMPVYIHKDGLLGWHEYIRHPQLLDLTAPYLGWLEIPSDHDAIHKIKFRPANIADCEVLPAPEEEGRPRAHGTKSGVYRTITRVYELQGVRVKGLANNCQTATRILQRAVTKKIGNWSESSVVATVCNSMKPPTRALFDMYYSWHALRHGQIRSFADFSIAWTALNRATSEVCAYIDFVTDLLPDTFAKGMKERARIRRQNVTRRGVILTGDDIVKYSVFFQRLDVPTYLYVNLNQLDLPEKDFVQANELRCSLEVDPKLNNIAQKQLHVRWYPVEGVSWPLFERTARGYLPRPDEADFVRSDQLMGKKRKNDTAEEQRKQQRANHQIAVKKFKDDFPEIKTSYENYKAFTSKSPALARYFAEKLKPYPWWAPTPLSAYAAAEEHAGRDLVMLACPLKNPADFNIQDEKEADEFIKAQMGERRLATFFPPLSVFTGVNKWERTCKFVYTAVRIMPMLHLRVKLARTDPSVTRYHPKEWKGILEGGYWKEVWKKEAKERGLRERREQRLAALEPGEELEEEVEVEKGKGKGKGKGKEANADAEPYDHEHFWKYGDERFFGKAESDRLKADPDAQPPLGRLLCHCEPTLEDFLQDPGLVLGHLYSINLILLAHWLAMLVPTQLAKAGIPQAKDSAGMHYTPDLGDAKETDSNIVWLIMRACNDMLMQKECPPDWTRDRDHRAWLSVLRDLFLCADHAEDVDEGRKWDKRWMNADVMREGRFAGDLTGLSQSEVVELEEHLFLRYYLTSFRAGQWPTQFPVCPGDEDFYCAKCRSSQEYKMLAAKAEEARARGKEFLVGMTAMDPKLLFEGEGGSDEGSSDEDDNSREGWTREKMPRPLEGYDEHLSDEGSEEGLSDDE